MGRGSSEVGIAFGGSIRSKTATKNEVLCRILAHDICVLIHEQHELGIEPEFWQDAQPEVRNVLPITSA